MIISHKYRFIFIKTAKTAGTSIETYLSSHCGPEDVLTPFGIEENGHLPRNQEGFYSHIPGQQIQQMVSANVWDNYVKFCVERNPWDKALSHYFFLVNRHHAKFSFDQYLSDGKACLNYPKYTAPHDRNTIIVDKVLKYENLSNELAAIFEDLGIPFDGELGVRAKGQYRTDRRAYKEVINLPQKEKIAQLYSHEIDLFGYTF